MDVITPIKKHYFLKSLGPRPTFQQDMTEEERGIMLTHIDYWTDLMNKGTAIVFGPVFDPNGGYGTAVVEVDNEEELKAIINDDPAVKVGVMTTEFVPMLAVYKK